MPDMVSMSSTSSRMKESSSVVREAGPNVKGIPDALFECWMANQIQTLVSFTQFSRHFRKCIELFE